MTRHATERGNRWQEVMAAEPCPICEKPDWCRRSPDGTKVACRRESRGAVKTKKYKDGSEAYLHILRDDRPPGDNGRPKPKRQRQDAPAAKPSASDQDTAAKRDAGKMLRWLRADILRGSSGPRAFYGALQRDLEELRRFALAAAENEPQDCHRIDAGGAT